MSASDEPSMSFEEARRLVETQVAFRARVAARVRRMLAEQVPTRVFGNSLAPDPATATELEELWREASAAEEAGLAWREPRALGPLHDGEKLIITRRRFRRYLTEPVDAR